MTKIVIQADRDAADKLLIECGIEADDVPQDVRNGEADDSRLVQLIASVRIASEQATVELRAAGDAMAEELDRWQRIASNPSDAVAAWRSLSHTKGNDDV